MLSSAAALWEYVRKLNKAGTTILLTTHYLEEAEELCDEIAIINKGRVIARDRKDTLMNGVDSKQVFFTLNTPLDCASRLASKRCKRRLAGR